MDSYSIATGTVTYAVKGRDILRRNGFKARIERTSAPEKRIGCGYTVVIEGNIKKAEEILKNAGVKILKINKMV